MGRHHLQGLAWWKGSGIEREWEMGGMEWENGWCDCEGWLIEGKDEGWKRS